MLKTYCHQTGKDWDEGVNLELFAVRYSVQESLGFSPFELIFGHSVGGPLKPYKEKLFSEDDSSLIVLSYVSNVDMNYQRLVNLLRTILDPFNLQLKKDMINILNPVIFNQEIRF